MAAGFNPRTRVGCDSGCLLNSETTVREFQSTHPRGVRPGFHGGGRHRRHCFNPRTRVGCDRHRAGALSVGGGFQSTHPRGVRLGLFAQFRDHGAGVSIHAPAWGATQPVAETVRGQDGVSIHAPAWGATADTDGGWDAARVSIHAPAWGATWGAGKLWR